MKIIRDISLFKKAEGCVFAYLDKDDDDKSHFLHFLPGIKISEYDLLTSFYLLLIKHSRPLGGKGEQSNFSKGFAIRKGARGEIPFSFPAHGSRTKSSFQKSGDFFLLEGDNKSQK